MKICPKCRFLDMEEFGPHEECPKCGVIYSQADRTVLNEKFWRAQENKAKSKNFTTRKTWKSLFSKKDFSKETIDPQKEKKWWKFEKIPLSELRPSWTWEEIKNGPKPRKWNFWLWVALVVAAAAITATSLIRITQGVR